MSQQIPTGADLQRLAVEHAGRCGVDTAALTGGRTDHSPINGERLVDVSWVDAAAVDDTVARAQAAFRQWRRVPAPERGAPGQAVRRAARRAQGGPRRAGEPRGREDHLRGPGRGPGDDRRLRLRRRPVPPALRPHHALGAARPPADGDLAPARRRRRHQRVQLPGRRLVVEHRDRPGLRRPRRLEALGAHPADRAGLRGPAGAGHRRVRGARRPHQVVLGAAEVGERLVDHAGVALVSATGSTRMGRAVGPRVAARFGRILLELGGNNAAVVTPSADLDLAVRAIVFSAAGTAGQRCTTMRRLIVHEAWPTSSPTGWPSAYERLPIGDPTAAGTLVGPLIHRGASEAMERSLERRRTEGGKVVAGGGRALADEAPEAFYARPAIVRMAAQSDIVRQETFAPLLYVLPYTDLDEAIALHNDVPQGLSSSIFTCDQREAERFLSPRAPTAASSTSTSARPAPRSAAPSAARRRPAAAASPARTRGAPTCGGPRTRSTTRASCRWPRASTSPSEHDRDTWGPPGPSARRRCGRASPRGCRPCTAPRSRPTPRSSRSPTR